MLGEGCITICLKRVIVPFGTKPKSAVENITGFTVENSRMPLAVLDKFIKKSLPTENESEISQRMVVPFYV